MTVKHATYKLAGPASDPRVPLISITANDEKTGEFTAIVSAFGNVDFQGDRTMPGSFKASLEKLRANGDVIPVVWSHDWSDPFAHVGFAWPANCREVGPGEFPQAPDGGLLVKGRFDISKPFARQVYDLIKDRRVTQWSFAYDVVKQRKAADGANELLVLDLLECGPTLRGANNMTATIDVKSRGSSNERAKKQKASQVLRMIDGVKHDEDRRYVPGLWHEIGKAMRFVIDDPDDDVDDVVEAAQAVLDRHLRQRRWADEDRKVEAKWATYTIKTQLDDIEASLHVKSQGRHESVSFEETNPILVREHLRQRHPNVMAVQLDSTDIRTLNQLHKLAHGGGVPKSGKTDTALTKAVDGLIADVRREKASEDADQAAFKAANDALLSGPIDWQRQDDFERARTERDRRDLEQKWAEREQLADEREIADIARRNELQKHGDQFTTWTDTPVQTLDERGNDRVEPRVTDGTVDGIGETFRVPVGAVDETDSRLITEGAPKRDAYTVYGDVKVDEPVPDKTVEPESFTLPTGAINDGNRKIEKE